MFRVASGGRRQELTDVVLAVLLFSALVSSLQPLAKAEQTTNVLHIVPKKQTKDTYMLCVGDKVTRAIGCLLEGIEAWDIPHVGNDDHGSGYCVRASISMAASFFGGNLSQDRITYYVKEEREGPVKDGQPENDLWHSKGFIDSETTAAFSWSLNGASITFIQAKPTFSEIEQWIDEGRPVIRVHRVGPKTEHATAINGYETIGEKVHIIDPQTAAETIESYATLSVEKVWVPPANATARSDEPSIWLDSDGDGMMDFDEEVRFKTDPHNPDSDGDGISDKVEVRSYVFLANGTFDKWDVRKPDYDNDTLRAELDPDSDNGGVPDGLEDLNRNGIYEPNLNETDPYDASDDPYIPPPVAEFTCSPEKPTVNEEIVFDASQSYSPKGNITSYEWNFNDGNITTVTEPTINHTYTSLAKYNVTLTVTDNNTLTNTTSRMVSVFYATDLNQDGTVNILDITTVAAAYNTRPGDEKWNAAADLDKNKWINILDISIIAKDYGKGI